MQISVLEYAPVTNVFETESCFLIQIHAKGCQFDTQTSVKHFFNLSSIMLSLIKIKDFHQYQETDHVYSIVRTGPRETHVVRTCDLVPASTMLVTPGIWYSLCAGLRYSTVAVKAFL